MAFVIFESHKHVEKLKKLFKDPLHLTFFFKLNILR
jgi:hypothetical protein